MNLATQDWWKKESSPTVKTAELNDTTAILKLLHNCTWQHQHADWRTPAEWLGYESCQLYKSHGRTRGFLAVTPDPLPVAWIRTLAIQASDPDKIFREMMDGATADLRENTPTTHICCLTINSWMEDLLQSYGFEQIDSIGVMARTDLENIPAFTPHTEVTIRHAENSDIPALTEIDIKGFENPMWWHSADQLQRGKNHSCIFLLAELDGKPVGFAYTAHSDRTAAHLVRITIDPACRGKKIGTTLLHATIKECKSLGYTHMSLNTPQNNTVAHKLYERYGFVSTGHQYPIWRLPLHPKK